MATHQLNQVKDRKTDERDTTKLKNGKKFGQGLVCPCVFFVSLFVFLCLCVFFLCLCVSLS